MVRSTTCITGCFFLLLFTSCGTILSGKKQNVVFSSPTTSTIQLAIWQPKPDVIVNDDSINFGNGEFLKVFEERIDSGTLYFAFPRPKVNQTLTLAAINNGSNIKQEQSQTLKPLDPMASGISLKTLNFQKYSSTFNEVTLLNFVIPWNWMIDAYYGTVLRWKISNPINPPVPIAPNSK